MLGCLKKDFKYKFVDKFLTTEEVDLLNTYAQIRHRANKDSFDFLQNNNGDTMYYGDPLMETILYKKINLMEKETGLKLLPTYAFWRTYTYNAELKKHKDRPSCEVSVTVMLGSDGTSWPIFMDGNSFDLKPGQALIYLGCELEHWRDSFKGDYHNQTFLHYVDQDGPFKDYRLDGRNILGTTKV
jgi:hypothetical protein